MSCTELVISSWTSIHRGAFDSIGHEKSDRLMCFHTVFAAIFIKMCQKRPVTMRIRDLSKVIQFFLRNNINNVCFASLDSFSVFPRNVYRSV